MIDWWGPVINEYYGATETGIVVWHNSEQALAKPGTVGRVVEGATMRIVDEQGRDVKQGEVGEIYLRGPHLAEFTYNNDEAKRREVALGDLVTVGDVGYQDADGYVFLCDRKRDMIISGGVNIYPAEVDAVLLEHPAVGDAATIGVPNPEWGEEVKAVVELQPGVEPSDALAAEILEFCRGKLASFKCPRSLDFVTELPRQDNGKIYKRLLRDRYREAAATEGANS